MKKLYIWIVLFFTFCISVANASIWTDYLIKMLDAEKNDDYASHIYYWNLYLKELEKETDTELANYKYYIQQSLWDSYIYSGLTSKWVEYYEYASNGMILEWRQYGIICIHYFEKYSVTKNSWYLHKAQVACENGVQNSDEYLERIQEKLEEIKNIQAENKPEEFFSKTPDSICKSQHWVYTFADVDTGECYCLEGFTHNTSNDQCEANIDVALQVQIDFALENFREKNGGEKLEPLYETIELYLQKRLSEKTKNILYYMRAKVGIMSHEFILNRILWK